MLELLEIPSSSWEAKLDSLQLVLIKDSLFQSKGVGFSGQMPKEIIPSHPASLGTLQLKLNAVSLTSCPK